MSDHRNISSSPKLLFVANWDWVIYNFRLDLARSAAEAGYEVALVCPPGKYVEEFRAENFRWIEWPLDRKSLNPVRGTTSLLALARIYEREHPALIHHDTIKPNVYGSLAVWLNQLRGVWDRPPQLINSFMGIGFMFSDRLLARFLRPLVLPIMRFGMQREYVFTTFSNRADYDHFVSEGLVDSSRAEVMVSEFVDTERFKGAERQNEKSKNLETGGEPLKVLMAARLLWDKGVEEFVKAARLLSDRQVSVEFLLAGEPDTEAQGYVSSEKLDEWDETGLIRWLGHRSDMPALLREVDVAVLPTHYNEGLPRFLVEAASSGLPLIASDLEACRRVVEKEVNGHVIPTKNASRLAEAIEHLANSPDTRHEMGSESRKKVLSEFDRDEIVRKWLDLYQTLLGREGSENREVIHS